MKRFRLLVLVIAASLLLSVAAVTQDVCAYDNKDLGRGSDWTQGGAHRLINELALESFIAAAEDDPILAYYDFNPDPRLRSLKKLLPIHDPSGRWSEDLFLATGSDVLRNGQTRAEKDAIEGLATKTFRDWMIDGGYSADEPEKYMSWRHFYNPAAEKGPAYLTDLPVSGAAGYLTTFESAMGEANPRIDALTWTFSHPANLYNWQKGQESLDAAFAMYTPFEAYANAWRSIGQTLHGMADLSVPAHVRNDSHPGNDAAKVLDSFRADAYEYIVSSDLSIIRSLAGNSVSNPILAAQIREAVVLTDLYQQVAAHVNHSFFSTDTIPYDVFDTNVSAIRTIDNNLDGFVYDLPDVKAVRRQDSRSQTYVLPDEQGDMIVFHASWLDVNGWDKAPPLVTRASVISQAERLVPIAIQTCIKTLDFGIPRVSLDDIQFDQVKLTGSFNRFLRQPDGSYHSTQVTGTTQRMIATLTRQDNGKRQTILLPPVEISDNRFVISMMDLAAYSPAVQDFLDGKLEGLEIELGLDLGGILVRSDLSSGTVETTQQPEPSPEPDEDREETELTTTVQTVTSEPDPVSTQSDGADEANGARLRATEDIRAAVEVYLGWLASYRDWLATGNSYYLVEDPVLLASTSAQADALYSEYLAGNLSRESLDDQGNALWRAYYLRCWQLTLEREYKTLLDTIERIQAETGFGATGLPAAPTTQGENPNNYDLNSLQIDH